MYTSRRSLLAVLGLVFAMVSVSLIITTPPARATHDTVSWSAPMSVIATAGFSRSYERIVSDAQGNIYVFYISSISGVSNINVTKYALIGPGGTPVKLFDKQVNDIANVVYSFLYSVNIDHSGAIHVAWTRTTTTLGLENYVSTSTDGGVTWQPAVRGNAPNAAGDDYFPYITSTPSGTLYLTWTQVWGGVDTIGLSKSTDGGLTFTGWTNVTVVPGLWYPVIASDSGGRLYLAYGTFGNLVSVSHSDDGSTWSPWFNLTSSAFPGIIPSIYVDALNYVHIAWFSYTTGGYLIRYSQSRDRGATWTGSIPVTGVMGGGYIGYLAGEGDTVAFVWGEPSGSFGFAYSGDHGATWYPNYYVGEPGFSPTYVGADRNGTLWVGYSFGATVYVRWWNGPPSAPIISSVAASGSNGLTVSWGLVPERNVAGYQVWRSSDGSTYTVVANLPSTASSFTDTGLGNGTYWYKVTAINVYGTDSHDSAAVTGYVGPTVSQLNAEIQSLQTQIAALQTQLAQANSNLAALQTQLSSLQTQLTNLQNSQAASNSATAAKLAQLQAELNQTRADIAAAQAAQATQSMALINTVLAVVIIVLLVLILVVQMRKPKGPQLMMAQPGQAPPNKPEDEL